MEINGTALSFDANSYSFSFAKSPSRDLQIIATKNYLLIRNVIELCLA